MKQKIKEICENWLECTRSLFWHDEDTPTNSMMEYRQRMRRRKTKVYLKMAAVITIVVSLIVIGKKTIDEWDYSGYKIITDYTQEVAVSAQYTEFGENLLKYGGDEIALLNRQEDVIWTVSETMNYPAVEVCQDACLVYDKKGTTFSVFDITGKIADVQTTLPILKAKVASQGIVAAILEDGDTTWVNVYDTDGKIIVTSKTQMESPGYPVDISLSSDGLLMAVSYVKIENNKISSYVTFYHFGNTGQNQEDNIVNSYDYGDTLIPDVEYLDDRWAVAFCEDGFTVYKGKQIPEEKASVSIEDEIMCVFHDESAIGMIVRNENSDSPYRMELYNLKGKLEWSVPMDTLFDNVKISQDQILLYSKTNFAVYSMKGVCRYQGAMEEGKLHSLFKIASNRYLAVLDSGIETFKLVN